VCACVCLPVRKYISGVYLGYKNNDNNIIAVIVTVQCIDVKIVDHKNKKLKRGFDEKEYKNVKNVE